MSLPPNATSAIAPPDPFALPEPPALDNTFGAILLGTFGGILLFGVTLHQTYRYFSVYTSDGRVLKSLVVIVVIIETVTAALSMHACYHYLVKNYFKPQMLLLGVWAVVVVAGILCLAEIGQSQTRVDPGLLPGKLTVTWAVNRFLCRFMIPTYSQYEDSQWLVSAGSTMAVTADTLLTVILIVVLRKSRTGVKRTDSMLDIMIMYSVNTGLLTGVFNLLSMLFSFTQKQNLIWICFGIIGAKMYGTTLLAALNSRQSIAAHGSGVSYETSPFGVSVISQPTSHSNAPAQAPHHRVPASKIRPRRTGDGQDYNDIIELKATQFDASMGSTVATAGATAVPFGRTSFTDDELDERTPHLERKALPV
ncbi:hypothetical protein BN946_scf184876.g12 [Trametes cinnabarina]|uniref:DUF6534 domain-containing protein n=1 Tax=Pycnoporus cinnabarinus TaxID=5643 RepID=A0A060SV69_PYCCI|nr:hypothetical protein BN946_scf184876.g12 [Trametes cinnabarina]